MDVPADRFGPARAFTDDRDNGSHRIVAISHGSKCIGHKVNVRMTVIALTS